GIQFWPAFKGRDGCRTPMVWTNKPPNGGFSEAKPWLPVPPEHLRLAVSVQEENDSSLLAHYRRMLAFRARHAELDKGEIRFIGESEHVLVFERRLAGRGMIVAINMSDEERRVEIEKGCKAIGGFDTEGRLEGGRLTLRPFGSWFALAEEKGGD